MAERIACGKWESGSKLSILQAAFGIINHSLLLKTDFSLARSCKVITLLIFFSLFPHLTYFSTCILTINVGIPLDLVLCLSLFHTFFPGNTNANDLKHIGGT